MLCLNILRQDPLKYSDTLMVSQRRRRLVDAQSPIVGFSLGGIFSFAASIFGNTGKLGQLFKDGKKREFGGLAFGTVFTVASFILGLTSGSSSSGPDYTEILNSINQTVTETYQAVLQIQDELHTISNQLASLQDMIQREFNALNAEVLKAQCISSFGKWRACLSAAALRHLQHPSYP